MPETCGKGVERLRTAHRKTIGQSSTAFQYPPHSATLGRVQAQVTPRLIRTFPQSSSPGNFAVSPLIEHYLYPISTAPTITTTEEKI